MYFIIGGAKQGKNEYAKAQYGANCRILTDYHKTIRLQLEKGEDAMAKAAKLLEQAEDLERLVIVCDEVGYGLVPTDAFERTYRETVGRVSCFLAGEASEVIRIVAGLPVRIK